MVADAPVMLVRGTVSDLVSEDKAASEWALAGSNCRPPACKYAHEAGTDTGERSRQVEASSGHRRRANVRDRAKSAR
jgi:hypothetical protein